MKAIFTALTKLISAIMPYNKPSNAIIDSGLYCLIGLKNNSNTTFKNLNISVKSMSCINDNNNKKWGL